MATKFLLITITHLPIYPYTHLRIYTFTHLHIYSFTHSFMQNKANFLDAQMNVSIFSKKAYENKHNWTLGENKPKQSQFPKSQNECKLTYNKGLQKKRRFRSPKKQTQFKPNFRKAKMNVNFYLTKEYENEPHLPAPGKQTQSNPICKILSSPRPGLAAEGIFPIITARKPSGEGE